MDLASDPQALGALGLLVLKPSSLETVLRILRKCQHPSVARTMECSRCPCPDHAKYGKTQRRVPHPEDRRKGDRNPCDDEDCCECGTSSSLRDREIMNHEHNQTVHRKNVRVRTRE